MPAPPRYAELRCRSCFSFLEGASHPEELVGQAAELGLSALALADVNGLHGIVRAHVEAKRLGLPLVVGAELVVTGLVPGRPARLVLLAMDREGYAGLSRLVTRAHCGEGWAGAPTRRERDEQERTPAEGALHPDIPVKRAHGNVAYQHVRRAQRPHHLARSPRIPGGPSDTAIGRNLSARNLPHYFVNIFKISHRP